MLKSRISLKLGTIDGFGEILTSTKKKVAILNSLGFTGTPPKNHKIYSFLHNLLANFGLAFQQVERTTSNLINFIIFYVYQT